MSAASQPASALPAEIGEFVQRRCRIFPVQARGKLPLIEQWPARASSDPAVLEEWASEFPRCNWGVATGCPSGIFVIDVDGEKGRASLANLERQGYVLPATLTVTTGRSDGGEHRYYRLADGVDIHNDQSGKLGEHIDVRGTGGFVVCPPSVHPSGKLYRFVDPHAAIIDAPAWVFERLKARPPKIETQQGGQMVGEGGRTNLMVSLVGSMHKRGMSSGAMEAALLAENTARCEPPLPTAKVKAIVADIVKRYPAGASVAGEDETAHGGLQLIRGDEIANVEQKWLVRDFLPDCTLSILAGLPGIGKTTASLSIAADITRGLIPIIGAVRPASDALMISNEDSPAHIRRAFERLGGDLSKLFVESDQGLPWGLDDCASLEDTIQQMKPAIVIIDSFFSHAPAKVDPHKHNEVAPALLRLRRIAETSQCAILLVHHGNKSSSDQPLLKIAGSVGITAVARHVLFVGEHPEDSTLRIVAVAKSNVAPAAARSQVFRLDPFGWIGSSNIRASDILQPVTADRRDEAAGFLRRVLAAGSKNSSDLQELARGEGISWASVRRAQSKLGIRPRKAAMSGAWIWALQQDAHLDAHPKNMSTLSTLSTFDKTKYLLTTSIVSPREDAQDAQFERGEQVVEHLREKVSDENAPSPFSEECGNKLSEGLPADPNNPIPDENTRSEGRFPGHGDAWEGPDPEVRF